MRQGAQVTRLVLLSRLFRSGVAAALLRPPSGKSAQLQLAVAIHSGDFFINVFKNNGADEWRKLWGCQHAVDDRCRETGALVIGLQDGPGRAASQSQGLRLLIERQITQSDESVANFPDFRRLSSLRVRWTSLHDVIFLLRPVLFARAR